MKFKKIKKLTVLSSVLLGTLVLSGSALAASSVSGLLGGVTPVSGYVNLGFDSATAATSCAKSNCSVTARSTYFYYDGVNGQEKSTSPKEASGFVQVSATASSVSAPTRAVRGTGYHRANDGGPQTWQENTVIYP
ncbi:hypothetical protein [Paenibacillus lautus]|uniref:hypothetical protein n=1 Tax=Paenibacillus lautus TaxID=1401 RepID=UPI001BD17BFF|nr:hypothetical protein [Paenibacillus lautus]